MTQGLVEVIHLRQDADHCNEDEDVGAGVGELVVAGKGQLDGNTNALDSHDRDGSDSAANRDVDQRVLASITRSHAVDHDGGEDYDQQHIEEEACFASVASFSADLLLSPNSPG